MARTMTGTNASARVLNTTTPTAPQFPNPVTNGPAMRAQTTCTAERPSVLPCHETQRHGELAQHTAAGDDDQTREQRDRQLDGQVEVTFPELRPTPNALQHRSRRDNYHCDHHHAQTDRTRKGPFDDSADAVITLSHRLREAGEVHRRDRAQKQRRSATEQVALNVLEHGEYTLGQVAHRIVEGKGPHLGGRSVGEGRTERTYQSGRSDALDRQGQPVPIAQLEDPIDQEQTLDRETDSESDDERVRTEKMESRYQRQDA